MDIVKVHYDEELQGVYGDDCRYLFDASEKALAEEVVKRINMHNELVENLKISVGYIKEIYSLNGIEPPKSAINRFESLLERCK